jgi:mono/diheme cytochrome c family protein
VVPTACAAIALLILGMASSSRADDGADIDFQKQIVPLLQTYCTDCHGGDDPEEGLDLSKPKSAADVKADRQHWEKVFAFVRIQAMPPADMDQPTQEERDLLLKWLDHTLFYVDCEKDPNPGRVTVRRLNRTEYNNTIRDLVGVKFQPADDFPSDDVGYGFDNIGDVLSISPLLMEKYLDAAEQIARKAIAAPEEIGIRDERSARHLKREGSAKEGSDSSIVMPSTGSVWAEYELPAAGEYLIRIEAAADQAGDELAKMQVRFDESELVTHQVKEDRKLEWYEATLKAKAGKHSVSASFINDFYDATLKRRNDRNLYVRAIEVRGPLSISDDELPPFHREFLKFQPGDKRGNRKLSATDAASANIGPVLARAFRRPVNSAEVSNFTRFVRLATDRGDSFERGMQIALQAILVAPEFLFRIEQDPDEKGPDTYEVGQFELASRLSYFLWSSMPDDELLGLAGQGRLADEGVLVRQIDRMLADPRSQALVDNFAGQWLGLRKLHTAEISPNKDLFSDWNDKLRSDIEQETLLFFGYIARENRSVLELLDARYSFVNERLAKLYGIEGVEGDEFRKVDLPAGQRSGLLTQASILTLTSYPERTSPVLRGEWVLTNLLGDEPPPPPPTVPGLDVTQKANPDASLREQLQLHRSDPGCASCHRVMDAIGFGLENFDAIGRWREMDGEHPIDATGELPSGETFRTPAELIGILRSREKEFARCLAEKLLTYALGRGMEYYDRCAVDKIVNVTAADKYRFHTLVKAIATSRPFLLRAGE